MHLLLHRVSQCLCTLLLLLFCSEAEKLFAFFQLHLWMLWRSGSRHRKILSQKVCWPYIDWVAVASADTRKAIWPHPIFKKYLSGKCFVYCNGLMDHICVCENGNSKAWYKAPGHFSGTLVNRSHTICITVYKNINRSAQSYCNSQTVYKLQTTEPKLIYMSTGCLYKNSASWRSTSFMERSTSNPVSVKSFVPFTLV